MRENLILLHLNVRTRTDECYSFVVLGLLTLMRFITHSVENLHNIRKIFNRKKESVRKGKQCNILSLLQIALQWDLMKKRIF